MTIRCFYHSSDLDGQCSGAIVRREAPDCVLYPINYGDVFPWEDSQLEDMVFMVDFCLAPFRDMIKLRDMCHLVWIDHHKTAIQDYHNHQVAIPGLTRTGIGACALTWEVLYGHPIPYSVRLLAEYDVWNHSDPNTLPFQWGMRLENTDPENQSFWEKIFKDEHLEEIIERGKTVLRYVEQYNEKYIKATWFPAELDGLRVMVVNKGLTNSQLWDSIWDPVHFDAMMSFCYYRDKWTVSLYTDKMGFDVSAVAKARGGGGHKQAAGFQCECSPLDIIRRTNG